MNICHFIGNTGRDPEIRHTQGGDKVANLSIAVTKRWRDKQSGERREKTTWVRLKAFGGVAGVIEQYVTKGDKIAVSCEFEERKWQAQDGTDRYSAEFNIRELELLTPKEGAGQGGQSSGGNDGGWGNGQTDAPDLDEEVPF